MASGKSETNNFTNGEIVNEELKSFIPDFISRRRAELELMRDAVRNDNFALLRRFAHNWKGFSRPFGFSRLEEFAAEILAEERVSADKFENLIIRIEDYLTRKSQSPNSAKEI